MGISELEPLIEEEVSAGVTGSPKPIPGQMALFKIEQALPWPARLAIFFTGIGIAALSVAIIEALAGLFQKLTSWLSFFGISTSRGIQHGAQSLTNKIGSQYSGVSEELGYSFHQLARVGRMLGAAALGAAYVAARVTELLAALAAKPDLRPRVQKVYVTAKGAASTAKRATHKAATAAKIAVRPIPAYIPQRIHGLEVQVKHQQVEIAQLQKQAKTTPHPSTIAQAIPVVALGLAGLGLNASRCEGTKGLNRGACELGPQGINDLLSLLAIGAGLLTLREYTQIAQVAVKGSTDVVKTLLSVP